MSYTDPSIHPSCEQAEADESMMDGMDEIEQIKEQIEYDSLKQQYPETKLDCIVHLIRNVLSGQKDSYLIGGEAVPAEKVRCKLRRLNAAHIEYIFDALEKTTTMVKNWPKYLLTALYNAPDTMDYYYDSWVRHDMRC